MCVYIYEHPYAPGAFVCALNHYIQIVSDKTLCSQIVRYICMCIHTHTHMHIYVQIVSDENLYAAHACMHAYMHKIFMHVHTLYLDTFAALPGAVLGLARE